ncbi:hypothetical protein CCP3SC15_480005 [Gammaproteobacteria bacterium]
MSDYLENINPANALQVLKRVVQDVAMLKGRTLNVSELDEITNALGTILAGEFRSGNGVEPDSGFSGTRMGYPGFVYGADTYNIVGILLDTLQFGLRASDGAGVFAAGKGVIDASGINLNGILYALRHYATDVNGANPRYGRLEMVYPDGRTNAALQMSFLDATTSAELMGTNRGFELNDLSQWTKTTETNGSWSIISGPPASAEGTYRAGFAPTSGSNLGVLTSQRIAVTGNQDYVIPYYIRDIATHGGATGSRKVEIKWYDNASAGTLLRTDTLHNQSCNGNSTWTNDIKSKKSPAGSLSFELVITATNLVRGLSIGVLEIDGFSAQAIPMLRTLSFEPDLMYQDAVSKRKVLSADMDLQVPRAPVAALVATGTGNLTNGGYTYKITCLDAEGETIPSAASNSVTIDAGHKQVTVTLPLGGTGTTSRKIYRTAASGTAYLLLATVANNTTTTYTDNIADANLGAAAPGVNLTGSSALFPTKALVRWMSDARSNLKAGITTAWPYSGSAMAPYGFIPYGHDAAAANNADWFEFEVYLAPGTYTMLIHVYKTTTSGKVDFYENDNQTPFTAGVDLYAASSGNAEKVVTGCLLVGSGVHHIRAVVNGKHASSSDYAVIIADIEFVRE